MPESSPHVWSPRRLLLVLVMLSLASASAAAQALSSHQAAERVQRETDSEVLSIQTLHLGKRKLYRIKVLTRDGKVRVLQVPAQD